MRHHTSIKTLIVIILAACISAGCSHAVQLGEAKAIPVEGNFTSAVWRPDGQGLALGGVGGSGLYYTNLAGQAHMISDAPLAGWRYSWSPDGQGLAYRVRDDATGMMTMMVAGASGESQQTSPYLNDLFPPDWDEDGLTYRSGDELVTLDKDGKVKKTFSLSQGRGLLARIASVSAAFAMSHVTGATFTGFGSILTADAAKQKAEKRVYVDPDNQIWIVDENGEKKQLLNMADEHGYFNPVESPNGKYAVSGMSGNLYIADPATGNPIALGPGVNPTWSPDGQWLIYQRTMDDGHNITESSLWCASADGSVLTQLTDSGTPENPCWSPSGDAISYVEDGQVFVAPIKP